MLINIMYTPIPLLDTSLPRPSIVVYHRFCWFLRDRSISPLIFSPYYIFFFFFQFLRFTDDLYQREGLSHETDVPSTRKIGKKNLRRYRHRDVPSVTKLAHWEIIQRGDTGGDEKAAVGLDMKTTTCDLFSRFLKI